MRTGRLRASELKLTHDFPSLSPYNKLLVVWLPLVSLLLSPLTPWYRRRSTNSGNYCALVSALVSRSEVYFILYMIYGWQMAMRLTVLAFTSFSVIR